MENSKLHFFPISGIEYGGFDDDIVEKFSKQIVTHVKKVL